MSGTVHTPYNQAHSAHTLTIPPRRKRKISLLTLLLTALALLAGLHYIAVTHIPPVIPPSTDCSALIRQTDYTKFIQLQPRKQELGAVQIVSQLTGGRPSVLVPVIGTDDQHHLDLYIYGCSTASLLHRPSLTLLYKQQGLLQGTYSISHANTLITSELDPAISSDAIELMEPAQQNIYREYTWSNGHFVQTTFPGLYPVLSRGEAEVLQDQANNGQSFPWTDPQITAEQMAKDIFHWSSGDIRSIVLDKNGSTAHITLLHQRPATEVAVTLTQLVQPNSRGLWFVTAAQTQGITLDRSYLHLPVTSPVTIQGTSKLSAGAVTTTLYDHTLSPLHILNDPTAGIATGGILTGAILYTNNIPNQPGLLLIEIDPPTGNSASPQLLLTAVMVG